VFSSLLQFFGVNLNMNISTAFQSYMIRHNIGIEKQSTIKKKRTYILINSNIKGIPNYYSTHYVMHSDVYKVYCKAYIVYIFSNNNNEIEFLYCKKLSFNWI